MDTRLSVRPSDPKILTYITNALTLQIPNKSLSLSLEQKPANPSQEIAGTPVDKNENIETLASNLASKLKVEKIQITKVKGITGRNGKEGMIQITFG
ncbi:unnamed protein product [Arctia plantaginis]|uniref:Uncharacterized protein n=1 Tax=Arctia plantaginis TaxID=874455 RepID=A0A8S1A201_ARCPL|nr:unnamed protein product [Arctia plantaginis]